MEDENKRISAIEDTKRKQRIIEENLTQISLSKKMTRDAEKREIETEEERVKIEKRIW